MYSARQRAGARSLGLFIGAEALGLIHPFGALRSSIPIGLRESPDGVIESDSSQSSAAS